MKVYKLTVNLDATLAVQTQNGSFHYFKPSVGAEMLVDETDDLTLLNNKFGDVYAEVIGPNFKAMVTELLNNSDIDENEEKKDKGCGCDNESCGCEPLEITSKPEEFNKNDDPKAAGYREDWE